MKMIRTLLLLCSTALLFTGSCRKDLPYDESTAADTIYPKPYLPIYPGSYWEYRNVSDSSLFMDYAGNYVLAEASNGGYHSGNHYGPSWRNHTYLGYCFTSYGENDSKRFIPELEEQAGNEWMYEGGGYSGFNIGGYYIWRYTDSTGLVKTVGDTTYTNVIKVVEEEHSSGYVSAYDAWYYYFARDVGLIEKGTYDQFTNHNTGALYRLEIYHINR